MTKKEQRVAYLLEYMKTHAEQVAAYKAAWHRRNKERLNAKSRAYHVAHREKEIARSMVRYRAVMEDPIKKARLLLQTRINTQKNRLENKARTDAWTREYNKRRRREDPEFAIMSRSRSRLRDAIRNARANKTGCTRQLLGCTPHELRVHIESLFKPGMTWENRHLWHIDHIRPCASFNLLDPQQQRCCFNYTNLQPLWEAENRSKSDKLLA